VKSKKAKAKANLSCSIRDRQRMELVQYMDYTIPQSMGMEMQNPLYLSCTSPKANLGKELFDVCGKAHTLVIIQKFI